MTNSARSPTCVRVPACSGPSRWSIPPANPLRSHSQRGTSSWPGLPRPAFQARIATARGTFYPDCLWEPQRLIGECDGAVKYGRAQAYVQEKEREQALRDAGFRIVRWLAKEIMAAPEEVVARVSRSLAG